MAPSIEAGVDLFPSFYLFYQGPVLASFIFLGTRIPGAISRVIESSLQWPLQLSLDRVSTRSHLGGVGKKKDKKEIFLP